jgi:hypothetical protein
VPTIGGHFCEFAAGFAYVFGAAFEPPARLAPEELVRLVAEEVRLAPPERAEPAFERAGFFRCSAIRGQHYSEIARRPPQFPGQFTVTVICRSRGVAFVQTSPPPRRCGWPKR